MNCYTVKSDYITQNKQHCGYIILQYTTGEYWTELYLFNVPGCIIREKTTDKNIADKTYTKLINEYCY